MRWPYSVIGVGGCVDPRWVASFTKVSFVNQSATGDWQQKASQTVPVSLESFHCSNTRLNLHWLTLVLQKILHRGRITRRMKQHCLSFKSIQFTVDVFISSVKLGVKMCPSEELACKRTDFHTGQYSGGFYHFLWKQSNLGNMQQTYRPEPESHRKCTVDCLKTMEGEREGFTVREQNRAEQEASDWKDNTPQVSITHTNHRAAVKAVDMCFTLLIVSPLVEEICYLGTWTQTQLQVLYFNTISVPEVT